VPPVLARIAQAKADSALAADAPVYLVGASSGGGFATVLAQRLPAAGALLIVSAGAVSSSKQPPTARPTTAVLGLTRRGCAQAFVYMQRDRAMPEARVRASAAALDAAGVRTAVFEVAPRPVTAAWLADRLPELDSKGADSLMRDLAGAGFVDAAGALVQSPRRFCAQLDRAEPLRSRLCELLSVAAAEHEITSEHFASVLEFWGLRR